METLASGRLGGFLAVAFVALGAACAQHGDGFAPGANGEGGTGSGDAASSNGDGGPETGPGDGGGTVGPDGGVIAASDGGQGIPCGATVCRGGSACVSNACVYPDCTGTKVPGDYATLQSALTALADIGGTVCLGAQTYSENVYVTMRKQTTIVGVSAGRTFVSGLSLANAAPLTLRGIGVTNSANVSQGADVTIESCVFGGGFSLYGSLGTATLRASSFSGTGALVVRRVINAASSGTGPFTLIVDGADVAGSPTYSGIDILDARVDEASTYIIQNSYIHDSKSGISWNVDQSNNAKSWAPHVSFVNNTVAKNKTGLDVQAGALTLDYFNDVFVANGVGISVYVASSPALGHGNNALYDNTANYAGTAVDGPGYVKTDPLLDSSLIPPELGAASPARGAGDKLHAPAADYWQRARGANPDIGAVQGH